jgi:CBS domain-containing protein
MRVKDIMTKIVVTIPEETSVEDAARIMKVSGIGLLPIGDKECVAGVITDRDITMRVTAEGINAKYTPVGDVMTRKPFHCFADDDVEDACFTMEDHGVRRLLVVDRSRDLVGILSLDDVATRTRNDKLVGHALSKVVSAAA